MSVGTYKKNAGPHSPDKFDRNKKHRKSPDQIEEGATGNISGMTAMTAMPTMSVNRLRQLAGLPASSMLTIVTEPVTTVKKSAPAMFSGQELDNIEEAMDHLGEVFNIYKKLNNSDKSELRHSLINTIMGEDGIRLSESVMKLLLNNTPTLLLEEFGNSDDDLTEDIDNIDNNMIKMSLARLAILVEAIHQELEK